MDCQDFLTKLNDNLIAKRVEEIKNEEFSLAVSSGKIKFLTVVESIQEVLTNENASIREKGIWFLSFLLSQLPRELFKSSEINAILAFYCDCLKGHHNFISPAVRGILELVKMKLIMKEDLIKTLVNLFQHVNCQTQLQPDRIIIYLILKFVIENYLEEVVQMGPDLVYGIISCIEGEADPFCLMEIFSFLPVLFKKFDFGHLREEMFEVLSCYFPIDFNASANENITITREDLAEGLVKCLSGNSFFSEQSISLVLEKAESTSKNAKLDSYKLLHDCCKTLEVESLEKHISNLWKCLSKDVLPGNDKQICDAALSALAEIFHLLSKNESHEKTLTAFVSDIVTTVKSLITRIDENMFQSAIRVLVAAASRSKPVAFQILHYLKAFFLLENSCSLLEKKIILSCLFPFLKIFREIRLVETPDAEEKLNYLDLIYMYLDAAKSVDYDIRKLGFLGILESLPDFSEKLQKILLEIILENIRTKGDIKISDDFVKIWRNLAENHSPEFYDFMYINFSLTDTELSVNNFLWAFSLIADIPKFTSQIIETFISVIEGKEKHEAVLESLLNSCRLAKLNESIDFFQVIHLRHSILERLISWYMKLETKEDFQRKQILGLISEIIALITRNQDPKTQQIITDKIIEMFLGFLLNDSEDHILHDQNRIDFSSDSVAAVLILEAVLGSIRSEITISMVWPIQEKLMNSALNSTDDSVRLSSSRLLATFVNKAEESLALDILKRISKIVFTHLEDNSDIKIKLNASVLFTWTIKGLILRGDQISEEWISTWFMLLERRDVGEAIAEGFRTVVEENDLYLNLESHCNVKILYRQRLFRSHPKLVKMYEMSNSSVRMNYLLALVFLLQGVPIYLIQTEISNIITVLVRCLDTEKYEVLQTSLEILTALLEKKEKIFSDYVQSFVPKFLKLARFEGYMNIRINALKCLYFYGFYPTVTLLPVKSQVIRDLEFCLDDKKRLTRKEAVKARCRWFLVGAPGENVLSS